MEIDPFFAVTDRIDSSKESKTEPTHSNSSIPSINPNEKQTNATETKSVGHNKTLGNQGVGPGGASISGSSPNEEPIDKIQQANLEISNLLKKNVISQSQVSNLQATLHENIMLQQKTNKLKSLLGRSAKAQNELKHEVVNLKQKLEMAHKTLDEYNKKMEQMANRPTHMDVLADFEANFDRALLSMESGQIDDVDDDPYSENDYIGEQYEHGDDAEQELIYIQSQSCGEDPSSTTPNLYSEEINYNDPSNDPPTSQNQDIQKLLTELANSQKHATHLESVNAALVKRAAKLEQTNESQSNQISTLQSQKQNIQLELRLSKKENSQIQNTMKEKLLALEEMQMEIDLVTKASVSANARASESMEVVQKIQTSQKYVDELEAKVDALQEWALASAEAKRLTVERAKELEKKLMLYHEAMDGDGVPDVAAGQIGSLSQKMSIGKNVGSSSEGRKLWTKSSSKVVGAGMEELFVVLLGDCVLSNNEMVVLKWQFDIIPGELDIDFSILKGKWDDRKRDGADSLIKERTVRGGAGGEVSGAFAVQNACTLIWSNKRSWVRPRAIKFGVEAFAINM